ncbi:murein hydrolase activator EnvC family protein [Colwellia chukchiensis]|nr:peptidoglycan DD-metalloendopeptidase family protein [Colwellia chukchiensis]
MSTSSQHLAGFLALIILLLLFTANHAVAQNSKQQQASAKTSQQLNEIQRAINQQKKALSSTNIKISDLQQHLKADDIAISKISKKLAQTSSQLEQVSEKLVRLTTEKKQLQTAKLQQEQGLAKQLRAAYSAGHHDYLKLMLNQQQASSVQRTLTYYQYLNTARIKEIERFQATMDKLYQVEQEYQAKAEQLAQLTESQQQQKQVLELSKAKQQQTLKALNSKALTGQQKLAKLEREEQAMVKLLKEMAAAAQAAKNLVSLSKLKRKLSWPVKGRISHSFGSRKQGYLKWKGVFIAAPIGRQVQAVHNGTILFADWLQGYGLVSVIDHGDGYMSLYGHNQTLLKSVGDRVEAGEAIALVGQSGGQSKSGLYFEIRQAGKAVNPKIWCK